MKKSLINSLKLAATGGVSLAMIACSGASENAAATSEAAPQDVAEQSTAPAPEEAAPALSPLEVSVLGDWRSDENKARDAYRNPLETLEFFELGADETVVEISPGGGWYTQIIAPYIKSGGGTYIAAGSGNTQRDEAFLTAFGDADLYGDVQLGILGDTIAPDSADTVLTFRNMHSVMRSDSEAKLFSEVFKALKPSGIFGIVSHRLPSAMEQDPRASTGYVHQDYVIQLAQDAGFELVASSEINANPADKADHPFGVWTLPPVSFSGSEDRPAPEGFDPEVYKQIGESDRFTLKFMKPADSPAYQEAVMDEAGADMEEAATEETTPKGDDAPRGS